MRQNLIIGLIVFLLDCSICFCFNKFEEMNSEMEESKELADNRLIELQKLQQDLQNVHQENNNMKVFLSMYFIAVITSLCFYCSPQTLNLPYCR